MVNIYKYVIVGGGLAGASAVEGIRELDPDGTILLLGGEPHLPYHRPPLSKGLWFKKKQVGDIFVKDSAWYAGNGVRMALNTSAASLDCKNNVVRDRTGNEYFYEKLLLATGGIPRRLQIPGGDMPEIYYYRTLTDYLSLEQQIEAGMPVLVIGGGFIGSEMAAALHTAGARVTMLFSGPYMCRQLFIESLGRAITDGYKGRDIEILAEDEPVSITRNGGIFITRTRNGREVRSLMVIAGIGIAPEMELAKGAGLGTGDGIIVNERLETSVPNVYAAGDNAYFPYQALGVSRRVEHWDNALNQGKQAGRNMAGAGEPYTYMPYFFSDLFEFGYEAVGDLRAKLMTVAHWEKENDTGVVYYMEDGIVRGVMLCNIWEKVDMARELIRRKERIPAAELAGAIQ